jgi:TRAP transporter 4TM/12TM fusion protein
MASGRAAPASASPGALPVDISELGDAAAEIHTRSLTGVVAAILRWVALAMAAYHVLFLGRFFGAVTDPLKLNAMHLTFVLVLAFLLVPNRAGSARPALVDWLLIACSALVVVYLTLTFEELTGRAGVFPTRADVIIGAILVVATLEATRRATGWSLPIMALFFMVYAFAGPLLPGLLSHKGFSFATLMSFLFSDNGIYGVAIQVSARDVYLFILFGAFIEASNIGKSIVQLALSVAGNLRGGPAKVSIITSALFGTASGSSVANVMVDGVINIPLMKATGFKGVVAGGIEAMNSTGGQIVPPVMGAAAFLMADILGLPYGTIAIAAIGPALLYYVAAYSMIDLYAASAGLRGLARAQLPRFWTVTREHGYLFIPLGVLLYMIMAQGTSPFRAALYALASTIVVAAFRADTRLNWPKIRDAIVEGAKRIIEIGVSCAAAGIVVGVLSLTGLGGKVSELLIVAAGGNLLLAMIATMIVAIVLGTGLPTTAAYAIGASVLTPALIKLGAAPLAAHMFLFYFSVISAVTPPVAFASFAAATIARAPMWETSIEAMRFGLAGYVVPFMFVYGPALLVGMRPWSETIAAIATATVGTFALAAAVIGYTTRPASGAQRAALGLASLLLIRSGWQLDVAGLALLIGVFVWQRLGPGTMATHS